MRIYEVGTMSDRTEIAAPNAATAAIYYAVNLCNTNTLFLAVVYTENGQEFKPKNCYWLSGMFEQDENKLNELLARIHTDVDDNLVFAGEMLWWCPDDGGNPVYGWHGMIYRGKELSEQCSKCFRDEKDALRNTLSLVRRWDCGS